MEKVILPISVKDRIRNATELIIQQTGIDGATVAEISRAAGTSVGAIYSCYANKTDLIELILMRAPDDLRDSIILLRGDDTYCPSPVAFVYSVLDAIELTDPTGRRSVPRLVMLAYAEEYSQPGIDDAVASHERSLACLLQELCSAYFEAPGDDPHIRGEVRLCLDLMRGGLIRVAAAKSWRSRRAL